MNLFGSKALDKVNKAPLENLSSYEILKKFLEPSFFALDKNGLLAELKSSKRSVRGLFDEIKSKLGIQNSVTREEFLDLVYQHFDIKQKDGNSKGQIANFFDAMTEVDKAEILSVLPVDKITDKSGNKTRGIKAGLTDEGGENSDQAAEIKNLQAKLLALNEEITQLKNDRQKNHSDEIAELKTKIQELTRQLNDAGKDKDKRKSGLSKARKINKKGVEFSKSGVSGKGTRIVNNNVINFGGVPGVYPGMVQGGVAVPTQFVAAPVQVQGAEPPKTTETKTDKKTAESGGDGTEEVKSREDLEKEIRAKIQKEEDDKRAAESAENKNKNDAGLTKLKEDLAKKQNELVEKEKRSQKGAIRRFFSRIFTSDRNKINVQEKIQIQKLRKDIDNIKSKIKEVETASINNGLYSGDLNISEATNEDIKYNDGLFKRHLDKRGSVDTQKVLDARVDLRHAGGKEKKKKRDALMNARLEQARNRGWFRRYLGAEGYIGARLRNLETWKKASKNIAIWGTLLTVTALTGVGAAAYLPALSLAAKGLIVGGAGGLAKSSIDKWILKKDDVSVLKRTLLAAGLGGIFGTALEFIPESAKAAFKEFLVSQGISLEIALQRFKDFDSLIPGSLRDMFGASPSGPKLPPLPDELIAKPVEMGFGDDPRLPDNLPVESTRSTPPSLATPPDVLPTEPILQAEPKINPVEKIPPQDVKPGGSDPFDADAKDIRGNVPPVEPVVYKFPNGVNIAGDRGIIGPAQDFFSGELSKGKVETLVAEIFRVDRAKNSFLGLLESLGTSEVTPEIIEKLKNGNIKTWKNLPIDINLSGEKAQKFFDGLRNIAENVVPESGAKGLYNGQASIWEVVKALKK